MKNEDTTDRVHGLHCLQQKIDRLSANGPSHYTGEQAKIDVLVNSLRGEDWAVDTIVNCGRSHTALCTALSR